MLRLLLGNLRRFRRLCELIQVQVCSRRPPPASPRASRKFTSSELRDSESGGSDISDKSSLLTGDGGNGEKRASSSSAVSRGKTCARKPAGATGSTAMSTPAPAVSSILGTRRPSPKSPSDPLANPILEELAETQSNNHDSADVSNTAVLDKSSLLVQDDNLEKMNVQNGLSPEQRENGNPPTSIVPNETNIVETNRSSSQDNNEKVAMKMKGKSSRGDSTDALLSDEEKSPNDENNPSTE